MLQWRCCSVWHISGTAMLQCCKHLADVLRPVLVEDADPKADCLKIDAPSYIATHWPLFVIGAVYAVLVVAVGVTLEVGRLCKHNSVPEPVPGPAGWQDLQPCVFHCYPGWRHAVNYHALQRSPPTGQVLTLLHRQCVCPWAYASKGASNARCPRMRESPPHTPRPTSVLPLQGSSCRMCHDSATVNSACRRCCLSPVHCPCRFVLKLTCQAILIIFLLLWVVLIAVALTRANRTEQQEHHRVAALSIRIEV